MMMRKLMVLLVFVLVLPGCKSSKDSESKRGVELPPPAMVAVKLAHDEVKSSGAVKFRVPSAADEAASKASDQVAYNKWKDDGQHLKDNVRPKIFLARFSDDFIGDGTTPVFQNVLVRVIKMEDVPSVKGAPTPIPPDGNTNSTITKPGPARPILRCTFYMVINAGDEIAATAKTPAIATGSQIVSYEFCGNMA